MAKLERENSLELRCVAFVEEHGGQALKLVPLGVRGFPDRSILMRPKDIFTGVWYLTQESRIWFAEFKRRRRGVVSAQQEHWRRVLTDLGFKVHVIDSDAAFEAAWKAEGGR